MNTFLHKLKLVFTDPALRRKVIFVLFALGIFRLLAAIPIPGVDTARLGQFFAGNQFFSILDIFAGGGLSTLSIVMLGVSPYITGSIIMQLLTIMVPSLKRLYSEEGEIGRKKFTQYSRMLTVPLAFLQGYSLLILLERQGILPGLGLIDLVTNLIVIVAGCMLLMWVGELVSEYGVGNGVSVIIFAGIVARLPRDFGQLLFSYNPQQLPLYILFVAIGLLVIAGVVAITEAERPVPVTYAKQVRGGKTMGGISSYIPLRVNMAGVMPIIFALSILLFPQMIGNFLSGSTQPFIQKVSGVLLSFTETSVLYSVLYFAFVIIFTYFYTAVTFDPKSMAENLQKSGAFIPGIRPGQSTELYVSRVVTRITLVGAIFLGLIAVLPLVLRGLTGMQSLAIGGTALLIVVSVVLDILKKMEAQISMREY
jgi:preprotein translocase subunit SecY